MTTLEVRPKLLGAEDHAASQRALKVRLTALFGLLILGIIFIEWQSGALGAQGALLASIALVATYGASTGFLAFRGGARAAEVLNFAPHLLREMSVGVVLTDADYRIVYANPAFSRMVARPVDRVLGTFTRDLVHPQDRAALGREQERRSSGESTTYRLRLWGDTPAPVDVLITASPFFDHGRFDGSIGLVHDVSETLLVRREAAHARNHSGFLFDAFTHDLSNSLQTVIGRAHIAMALAKAGHANSGAALASAAAAAERTARLLRDVKQISMAEREDWPQRETTVGELIERAVADRDLNPNCVLLTDMPRGVGTLRVQASEIGYLVVSKLIEEAASHPARGAAPAPITLEVRQGELGPSSAIVRVRGCLESRPIAELEAAMNAPRDIASSETPWRSGVRLVLAAAVAEPHGWKLRAYLEEQGAGTVFELRMPTQAAAPEDAAEGEPARERLTAAPTA